MAQSDELTQRLFEAIDTIIGERISSLPYDQTIVCKIIDAEDKANGVYTVSHNFDTTFTAYADFTGFEVDDEVYVRIPEGDYTKQKVITGKYLDGLLIAGETQNISITGDTTYLLYDKNNQIHIYDWSKTEREIKFSYYNSADESQTWKKVLNTFSNLSMDYERANAIKLVIGNNEEVIVYFYKYNNGITLVTKDGKQQQERVYRIAAEQYGVTAPTYIPDIEHSETVSQGFTTIQKDLLFAKVDKSTMLYKKNVRYYILNNNDYIWQKDLTEFDSSTEYYYIPDNVSFYQNDEINVSIFSPEGLTPINVNPMDEEGHLIDIDLNLIFDFSKNIWYWVPGEIVIDVSSIPMLNSMRIYYSELNLIDEETDEILNSPTGTFHLLYTIAPELDPEHATIPISIQYCPAGETTNVRASTGLTFGYITELNDEVNITPQLKRNKNNHVDIVPAITMDDTESEYYIEVLINDKFGNKINNDQFMYRWSSDNTHGITIDDTTGRYDIGLLTQLVHIEVGTYIDEEWITYQRINYPLALRKSDDYYIESPTVITYNESGVNPTYFNNFIELKSYQHGKLEYDYSYSNNSLFTIDKKIMRVNNIYQGTSTILSFNCVEPGNESNILWTQFVYFTKKYTESYIRSENFETVVEMGVRTTGALAAQATATSGLVFSYDDKLELNCYNTEVSSSIPILHADSNGTLQIGYDDFTMTGHITEGARYLEDSSKTKITKGTELRPVYFTSAGVPEAIGTTILNKKDDDDYKIVPQLATSRIETISSNKTITNADNGKFFIMTSSSTITLNNNSAVLGTEFELMWFGSGNNAHATLKGSGTTLLTVDNATSASSGNSVTVSEKGGVVAAKYLGTINNNGPYWIITGTID